MASIASVCRLSARAASQQLRNHGARRAFHNGQASLAAQNFNMPALSPTMTEGNIATWKIKEGDSFSAGDVLLEIETDKAQMDVEAQDDGILAKIIQGDGSKAVQVGTRIAVTAEPGDDLASLEIPAEDNAKKAEAPKEQPKQESAPAPKKAESAPSPKPASSGAASKSTGKAQKQKYPLYPSVQHLLKVNGLPKEEADKIPATGPNGRLLKGDVLAYIGSIEGSYASELAERIHKLAHLDLSNIKVAAPKEKPAEKPAPAAEAPAVVEEPEVNVSMPISLQAAKDFQTHLEKTVGVNVPVSELISRAVLLANEDLPRSQVAKPTSDELFNAVLGQPISKLSRGNFQPEIWQQTVTVSSAPRAAGFKKPDILDILAGKKASRGSVVGGRAERPVGLENVFSVSVPKGDQYRGRVFLERVKTVLEDQPGQLVIQ